MKTHAMLDIETLGTSVGSVVASVGLVMFNEKKIIDTLHVRMSVEKSQSVYGLTIDASTVLWWLKQSKEAQEELRGESRPKDSVKRVIARLALFSPVKIWGNGPGFDNELFREAAKRVGFETKGVMCHKKDACYRTVFSCYGVDDDKERDEESFGPSHVAINDAKRQANNLIAMCRDNSLNFLK